jgi:hypothetical protein
VDISVNEKIWWASIAGSVLLHAGLVGVFTQVPGVMGRSGGGVRVSPAVAPMYLFPAGEVALGVPERRDEPSVPAERERAPGPMITLMPPPVPPEPAEPLPPLAEPAMVKLGVDQGKAETPNWLASLAEGEHGAKQSSVEQPGLDRNARPSASGPTGDGGSGGNAGSKSPAELAAAAAVAPAEPAPAQAVPLQAEAPAAPAPPTPAKAGSPAVPAIAASEAVPQKGSDGGSSPSAPARPAQPEQVAKPEQKQVDEIKGEAGAGAKEGVKVPTVVLGQPQPAGQSGVPGAPGLPGAPDASNKSAADRDSDATSRRRVAVFRNGRVDAGQGLDIRTVRPEFTSLTRAVVPGASPTIEITFSRGGRVSNVRVLRSSGFKVEIDDPVVVAAYNWRASGQALRDLPEKPDAGLKIEVTILLN